LGKSLRKGRDRRLAKKQWSEGFEKRSGGVHNSCVALRALDSKHKMKEIREKNTPHTSEDPATRSPLQGTVLTDREF
jgi:hypothetical protein